jgi:hypothetical protein
LNALLIGGSGYLGGLVAAGLLDAGDQLIVAPLRGTHTRETVLAPIQAELRCEAVDQRIDLQRVVTVPLPAGDDWSALDAIVEHYAEALHVISPRVQLQLIHQNAFKNAFVAACRQLPLNSIVNLVSRPEGLPTARALTQQFCEKVARPQHIFFYNKLADVRSDISDRRMRMLLEFTAVNSEISAHAWRFENTALRTLRSLGLQFADATLETVLTCQNRFVEKSPRIQAYLSKNEGLFATHPGTIEIGAA